MPNNPVPVEGDPDFIGPSRADWTYINPNSAEFACTRAAAEATNGLITVEEDPFAAIQARDGELDSRKRKSIGYITAREKTGAWLAVNLSARGISVGTLEALHDLESAISIARRIAEGEKIGTISPGYEDRIKAATAVAIGAKAHVELTKSLLDQLKPETQKDSENTSKPRGPSRNQPVVPIQAGNVHMHFNEPAKNGTDAIQAAEDSDAG